MDLLIFAIIAVYFIYKINTVLGNRNYTYENRKFHVEDISEEMMPQEHLEEKIIEAKVELTDEEAIVSKDEAVVGILKQIRVIDKNFKELSFIRSASIAFEMILKAFPQSDRNTLKMLLSHNIYEEFLKHIEKYEKAQITIEQSLVSLKEALIVKGKVEGKKAFLTVKFISDQIYALRDKDHNVIEGDPSRIIDKVDLWTFSKDLSKNEPIWELIAT